MVTLIKYIYMKYYFVPVSCIKYYELYQSYIVKNDKLLLILQKYIVLVTYRMTRCKLTDIIYFVFIKLIKQK